MLWLETSVIVLLFVLIVLGVLTVIFAGRRQVLPPSLTVEENVVTLEGMGKGRNENGQIRKRKVGGAPDVEGIEEFMVIAEDAARKPVRSLPVQERTEETTSTPTEEKDDLTISLLHSTPNTEDTEKLNDDTQDKERKNKEKKPLPQSQPLPQPHTEAEPIQTAQDIFLSSCQNASKCAECDQTFTLLFRRVRKFILCEIALIICCSTIVGSVSIQCVPLALSIL